MVVYFMFHNSYCSTLSESNTGSGGSYILYTRQKTLFHIFIVEYIATVQYLARFLELEKLAKNVLEDVFSSSIVMGQLRSHS